MWYWSDPTVLFSNPLYFFDGSGPSVTPVLTTQLAMPGNFTAVVNGVSSVTLAWTANGNANIAGYQIWRDQVIIATVTTATYIDTAVQADRHYRYAVNAVDATGRIGPQTLTLRRDVLTSANLTFEVVFQEQPGEGGYPDVSWRWQ